MYARKELTKATWKFVGSDGPTSSLVSFLTELLVEPGLVFAAASWPSGSLGPERFPAVEDLTGTRATRPGRMPGNKSASLGPEIVCQIEGIKIPSRGLNNIQSSCQMKASFIQQNISGGFGLNLLPAVALAIQDLVVCSQTSCGMPSLIAFSNIVLY
jgi:hypothetical protein